MCDPVSIGLGALSTISNARAQQAQIEAQNAAYEENVRASVQAKVDADRQANLQRLQADEAAAEEAMDNDLAVREQVARSIVAGGESGAIGATNASIVQNIMRQGLMANNRISQNLGRELAQISEEGRGLTSQYQSRINSVSMGGKVDALGAIASGVSTGIATAGAFSTMKANASTAGSAGKGWDWTPWK